MTRHIYLSVYKEQEPLFVTWVIATPFTGITCSVGVTRTSKPELSVAGFSFDTEYWTEQLASDWLQNNKWKPERKFRNMPLAGNIMKLEERSYQDKPRRVEHTESVGKVFDVKIIGFVSKNGRKYTESCLRKAAPLYNNVKVNFDHTEKGVPRTFDHRFGKLVNPVFKEGDGIYGDLEFNPHHTKAKAFAWYAANQPDAIGFSHNSQGKAVMEGGILRVDEILEVIHVDIVADPATTNGLFESENNNDKRKKMEAESMTIEDLRKTRPDLVKIITEGNEGDKALKEATEKATKLQEQLAESNKKIAENERKEKVAKVIADAKLPSWAITEHLKTQLSEAKDDAAMTSIMEHTKALVKNSGKNANEPKSKEGSLTEGTNEPLTAKSFAEGFKAS